MVDDDIKKDILGWVDLDRKAVEETVSFIEAKEMAREAMERTPIAAAISGYKMKEKHSNEKHTSKPKTIISCDSCSTKMEKYVWNPR